MVLAPAKNKVYVALSSFGLTGLYSLTLPIAKSRGKFQPQWTVSLSTPLCDYEVCSDTGPMAFFNNELFVGSGDHLLSLPAYFHKSAIPKRVLNATGFESDMTGLSTSIDGRVMVATWFGSAFSRNVG